MKIATFNKPETNNYWKITLVFSALILLLVSANLNWPKKYSASIIEADGKGYYAWLPALFIYQDLHFGFFETVEKKYTNPQTYFDYRLQYEGKTINKYPVGTALMELPFFLVAHAISLASGQEADGYSYWYPIFISLAAIFYAIAGLYLLGKFLQSQKSSGVGISLVILALLFATNLFYYTVGEPGMSHVYSFALAAGYLRLLQLWAQKQKPTFFWAAAFIAGMILLVRPMNLLLLASFPFAFQTSREFNHALRSTGIYKILTGLLLFIAVSSFQPWLWYLQTGSFFVDTYPGEYFGSPHLLSFLFSFKKGAFLYTPVLLIAILGLRNLYRQSSFHAIYWVIYMLIVFTILSSWNNWWYGGSFSSRVLVEYLPIFAIPLTSWLGQKNGRNIRFIILGLLLLLCQFQTYQYRYFIIHWENMTQEKYFDSFKKLP